MWSTLIATLQHEFSELANAAHLTQFVVRMFVAVALGGVIGFERERRGRAAGLRTHMLIALGVVVVVIAAEQAAIPTPDMSRVLQGILAGIGFLGAGAILKHGEPEHEHVRGLTTAASVWATAGIAIAAGLGRAGTAILATIVAVVILAVVGRIERRVGWKQPFDDDRRR